MTRRRCCWLLQSAPGLVKDCACRSDFQWGHVHCWRQTTFRSMLRLWNRCAIVPWMMTRATDCQSIPQLCYSRHRQAILVPYYFPCGFNCLWFVTPRHFLQCGRRALRPSAQGHPNLQEHEVRAHLGSFGLGRLAVQPIRQAAGPAVVGRHRKHATAKARS